VTAATPSKKRDPERGDSGRKGGAIPRRARGELVALGRAALFGIVVVALFTALEPLAKQRPWLPISLGLVGLCVARVAWWWRRDGEMRELRRRGYSIAFWEYDNLKRRVRGRLADLQLKSNFDDLAKRLPLRDELALAPEFARFDDLDMLYWAMVLLAETAARSSTREGEAP
jgi:hypothetical protein